MKFTTQLSIDTCRRKLLSHISHVPIFADTIVVVNPLAGKQSEFVVKRVHKVRWNLFQFNALEVVGTLTATGDRTTDVTARLQLNGIGVAIFALILFLALVLTGDPRNGGIWGVLLIALVVGLLCFDWYVLHTILHELEY